MITSINVCLWKPFLDRSFGNRRNKGDIAVARWRGLQRPPKPASVESNVRRNS